MALTRDDEIKLAHLLRRAGFGVRPGEWQQYSALGIEATIQRLLHPEDVPDNLGALLKAVSGDFLDFERLDNVRQWWLYRMVHSPRQLEEKMVLFWHNHFATANFKVNNPRSMWRQNETFRRHALGSFRSLLLEVVKDPAMLVWLDGAQSRNDAPNENFARELLELFTMGVGGGYSERDVQHAARAFTGWTFSREADAATFNPYLHDDGAKNFMGQIGNLHSDDIVDIVVRQPATARHLSTKLWKFFVHDNPTTADIARLERAYFESGFSVGAVVEAIFTSPAFFAAPALYARVKSPVEYVVNVMRTLDAQLLVVPGMGNLLTEMGQELFNPPSVKGWPQGLEWINTRTLLSRVNFTSELTDSMNRRGQLSQRVQGKWLTPDAVTADAVVQQVWNALLPGRALAAPTRATLVAYVQQGAPADKIPVTARLPGLISLVMGTPEYQLA